MNKEEITIKDKLQELKDRKILAEKKCKDAQTIPRRNKHLREIELLQTRISSIHTIYGYE